MAEREVDLDHFKEFQAVSLAIGISMEEELSEHIIIRGIKRPRTHEMWMSPYLFARTDPDQRNTVCKLEMDFLRLGCPGTFRKATRMPPTVYKELLDKVRPLITYRDTNFRESVKAIERLSLTIRYLTRGSFYGDSYLRVPLEDASSETDIKLHFRTHRADGLLMLAAGSPDYCVLELKNGIVRVRIDLGSGEAGISSTPGVRFDDWQWHYVQLMRSQDQVQLTIDGLYTTTTTTPGRFFELNINRGIFLGGVGSFVDVFFGNFKDYRGCLRHVLFNSIDVFQGAQQQVDPENVYGIEWECSSEFGATSQQPISFLSNTSFLALPSFEARREGSISFDIRTRTKTALLFYNAGNQPGSDFLAVELLRGKIQLVVNKGSGEAELMHEKELSDGTWHQVEVIVELTYVRITVDRERREVKTNFGANRFLDLHGYLFVGGVSLQDRGKAIQRELVSLKGLNGPFGSLVGCMQNLRINTQVLGFREAQVTRGLKPECVWTYPCLSSPCIDGATCVEHGHYGFECLCARRSCVKIPGSNGQPPKVPLHDILVVQDAVVREGGRVPITSSNIDIMFDYEARGLRASAIVFQVVNLPEHGQLKIDVPQHARRPSFTLQDLNGGKVTYIHDGTEGAMDSIGMELEFLNIEDDMPAKLKQKYGFTLIVKVAPWNDKPDIVLPDGETLVLVENTQVKISPKILHVSDKDDSAQDLEYSVRYPQAFDVGYFEISDSLGVRARITAFTQEDVNEGRIRYIHRGNLETHVRLQVSDGKDTSDPKNLKVQAVPLKLSLLANTGLLLAPGATLLITRNNLTFNCNAPNQDIDIRYDITDAPYYGFVQRQQYANNQWVTVTTFTQAHIDKSRIRYIHTETHLTHEEDWFKFKVSAMMEQTEEMMFEINFLKATVQLARNNDLLLKGVQEGYITSENLLANSSIQGQHSSEVTYSVLTLPHYGHLFRFSPDPDEAGTHHKQRLVVGANFSQADLDGRGVQFHIQKDVFSRVEDEFQFRLLVPGDISQVYSFKIIYEPLNSDIKFINNGLSEVFEGESKIITTEELYMETTTYKDFRFTIISGPSSGMIQLIDPATGRPLEHNASTTFTNDDIKSKRVVYKHDNTENTEDSFNFIATPIIQDPPEYIVQEIREITGTFDIRIQLRNDNPPMRLVEKVFNVVANRGRVVSGDDLAYYDPDIDYDSSKLQYEWRGIPNGELVLTANESSKVGIFTQRDLENGNIMFKHKGPNYGRAVLWVTDGQFTSSGLFEVRASDPYIRFLNNTGLSVQKGEMVPILWSNLSLETNLDCDDKDVKFIIETPPSHGRIVKNNMEKQRFNLADVKNEIVSYEHDGSNNLVDMFSFLVKIEDVQIEGEMRVKAILESHQDPPHIVNNKVKVVDEKAEVVIVQADLEVTHPEVPDEEIRYSVTDLPKYGSLSLEDGASGENLRMFTQEDVNEGRLKYKHDDVGPTSDTFMFDVTNGIQSLQGLEFVLEIVPTVIPVTAQDFHLVEGESRLVTDDMIHVTNRHFRDENIVFIITQEPVNGIIESRSHPGQAILQFTQNELQGDFIYYVHDGNDTTADRFSIMAKSDISHKQSNPHTVNIRIKPTNDQAPRVVKNQPLEVWTGSVSSITADHLKAVDRDTAPAGLMYVIDNPSNGDVMLESNQVQNIVNFTQAAIDAGQIVFVHKGPNRGGFSFKVNDGVNYSKRISFVVIAKALILNLTNNNPLEVYPGILQPVSPKNLQANTNDEHQWRPITFTLQTKPENGKLMWSGNGTGEVLSFTQEDLDEGRINYQHNAPMGAWSQEDQFTFDVSTAYASSLNFETFKVLISYENINDDNKAQLIQTTPLEVEEGGSVVLERSNLDLSMLRRRLANSGLRNPEVHYIITAVPTSGVLIVNSENATKGTTFMQKDINKGRIQYTHDDSDTAWDTFHFNIEIEVSGGVSESRNRKSSHLSNVFNITVRPVNDQPFSLQTDSPEIRLVQGFTAVITQKELHTTDPDTPPEGIIYNIINGPDNGIMVLARQPDNAIRTFTQKDIDDGQVVFVQDGSMESGAFYFHVSDGAFKPYYKVFNIQINPLTLELHNTSTIRLLQGHSSVFFSSENIHVETNGNRDKIMYNVTKPPQYGQLFMHDHPVYQFSQRNIDEKEITYIQTDMSSGMDMFEFIIYDSQNMLQDQRLNITVDPRVKQKTPNAQPGARFTLTTDSLDAGDLAISSGSDPVYTILAPPRLGVLFRKAGNSDEGRERREAARKRKKGRGRQAESGGEDEGEVEVSSFSHQDIVDRRIVYQPHPSNATHDRTDSFNYRLTASNSQPATNIYYIRVKGVVPPEKKVDNTPTPVTKTPAVAVPSPASGSEEEIATAPPIGNNKDAEEKETPGYSLDRLVIIILVSVITVLVVVGLIIMQCLKVSRRRREKLEKAKEDSRTPLAQPNVHIEPQKLNMATYHDDPNMAARMRGVEPGIPAINITPDTPQMFEHHGPRSPPLPPSSRHRSRSRSPSSANSRSNHSLPRPHSPGRDRSRSGSPPPGSQGYGTYRRQGGAIPVATPTVPVSPAAAPQVVSAAAAAQLQAEAEVSRTVPTCKVTPLFDGDGVEVHSPSGTLKRDQVTFDWENVDPELLQHCRTTNPVLHENKYWV